MCFKGAVEKHDLQIRTASTGAAEFRKFQNWLNFGIFGIHMAETHTPRFQKFRNVSNFVIFGMPVGGNDRAPIRRPGLSDALCGGHLHGLVFQTTAPHREDVFRRPPAKRAPPDPRPKIRSCRKPVPSQTISRIPSILPGTAATEEPFRSTCSRESGPGAAIV